MAKHCGQVGYVIHQLANGHDERPVVADRAPKSIGKENTFAEDIQAWEELKAQLWLLVEMVGWRLRRQGLSGRTITVKVRFASFRTITRSKTFVVAANLDETIFRIAEEALANITLNEGVRLLGVTVSGLVNASGQMSLFDQGDEKIQAVAQAVDRLKERFGEGAVTRGGSMIVRQS